MMPAAPITNLDIQSRYPGLAPFKLGDSNIFFGRTEEIERLHDMVRKHQQILVYGKSGLGKSSLVNAGLMPRITQEKPSLLYFPRIGYWVDKDSPSPITSLLAEIEKQSPAQTSFLTEAGIREETLWYWLKETALMTDNLQQVIVFDQFEELFSHPPEEIFHFKKQLGELLYRVVPEYLRATLEHRLKSNPCLISPEQIRALNTPMNIKVIYLIREDKYSQLNSLKDLLPDICSHTFEIKPMVREQAREAIILPAKTQGEFRYPPFEFENRAVEMILSKLADPFTQTIETTQLQIVCRKIEGLRYSLVREHDLPDFQELIGSYLNEVIKNVPLLSRASTIVFLETKLVHNGQRVPVAEQVCISEIGERALSILLENHLLRAEINGTGGTSYELGHDTMLAPILENRRRREIDEALEHKRKEHERQEQMHKAQEKELRTKLIYAQQARRLEQRRLRITRIFLGFAIGGILCALVAGWVAYRQMERVQNSEERLRSSNKEKDNALRNEKEMADRFRTRNAELAIAWAEKQRALGNPLEALDRLNTLDSISKKTSRVIELVNELNKEIAK